eukprot:3520217-Rhodomonas_salina.1
MVAQVKFDDEKVTAGPTPTCLRAATPCPKKTQKGSDSDDDTSLADRYVLCSLSTSCSVCAMLSQYRTWRTERILSRICLCAV